jgi:hypothetical protein
MKMRRFILSISVLVLLMISPVASFAQCAMCRTQVESNINGQGKVVGRGLNDGILYLMTMPYLILAGFGYMAYKNWKNSEKPTA